MFIDDLCQYVLDMVSAGHESCKRIHLYQKPSKQFIIGSLADSSKDYTAGSPTGENKIQTKSALRHNSLSIFFLIKRTYNGKISINPSCAVFYKVFPDYKEQKDYIDKLNAVDMYESVRKDPGFKTYYKRLDVLFDPIEYELKNGTQSLDFRRVTDSVKGDDSLFRNNRNIEDELKVKDIKNHFDPDWVKNEEIFNTKLTEIKTSPSKKSFNWEAIIEIEREQFDDLTDIITVRMINTTRQKVKFEKFLFNCTAELSFSIAASLSLVSASITASTYNSTACCLLVQPAENDATMPASHKQIIGRTFTPSDI